MAQALWRIEEAQKDEAVKLDLSRLALTTLPEVLGNLTVLQALYLAGNQLTTLPGWLGNLTALQRLLLSENQLTTLPQSLGNLTKLQTLHLYDNRLTTLPESFGNLISLRTLYINANPLTTLPESLGKLTNLENLALSNLTVIPEWLGNLTSLRFFALESANIVAWPEWLSNLTKLRALYLNDNQLTTLPEWLGNLTELQRLYLSGNQLTTLPEWLGDLTELQRLDLARNQLTTLPASLGSLTKLQSLSVSNNQLTTLPTTLKRLSGALLALDLDSNPDLRFPPKDIVELGKDSVLRYLKAAGNGEETVWESKVLLVGEGGVGKTWLYQALNGRLGGGNKQEEGATVGVEIGPLFLEHPQEIGETMRLNCWDFSGQTVNHATHQFFFSAQSLFVLCWNARAGWEAGKLHRWLNNIRDRAPGAKVLLVATQWDQPHADYPEKDLLRDYPQIVGAYKVSSTTGEGITELKQAIAQLGAELPLMGLRWPVNWRIATLLIQNLSRQRDHISVVEIKPLLLEVKLEEEDIPVLLRWLHELGEILYFGNVPSLEDIVMLSPQQVTKRVGEVLASHEVENAKGILTKDCLQRLWPDLEEHIRLHLLGMMDEFDLAYRIPEDPRHRSVVVERLPQNAPAFEPCWNQFEKERELRLRFKLKAMHPGIPTWLIARCHRFVLPELHWLRGAVFSDDRKDYKHLALVRANDSERYVDFAVRGPFPPTLMTLLTDGFLDTVQRRYPGLEMERLVPCPGPGAEKQCGHFFKLTNLENRLTQKEPKLLIECEECGAEHEVTKLLLGLSVVPSVKAVTLAELQRVIARDGDKTRQHLDKVATEMMSYIQLQFIRQWNTEQQIAEHSCPTVFSLYSLDEGTVLRDQKLRLQLYCMKPGCWHSIGESGKRDLAPLKAWAVGLVKFLSSLSSVAKPLAFAAAAFHPLAVPLAGVPFADMDASRKDFDATAKFLAELEKIKAGHPEADETWVSESREPHGHDRANLIELKQFLEGLFQDKTTGEIKYGLERARTPEDHILWLCPTHAAEYRKR